jgi:hypothetical protein
MEIEKIKEAVEQIEGQKNYLYYTNSEKELNILVYLAKQVIEVAGVLPAKIDTFDLPKGMMILEKETINKTIDACTLAIAGGWVKREDYDLLQERYDLLKKERDELKFPDISALDNIRNCQAQEIKRNET